MNIKALAELDNFTGTGHYFRQPLTDLLITDGVKFLRDNADCQWLIDQIGLAQKLEVIRNDPMLQILQFWELKSIGDRKAVLSCLRDEGDIAYSTLIEFTDFPFDTVGSPFKIWVATTECDGRISYVAYLPSEH